MKTFKIFTLGIMISIGQNLIALKHDAKLLLYVSEDSSVNLQYYEMLKLKFPAMDIRLVASMKEFYTYIPERFYKKRISTFYNWQKYLNNGGSDTSMKELTEVDVNQERIEFGEDCYFFDISSTLNTSGMYTSYMLELVRFKDNSFEAEPLMIVRNIRNFGTPVIPLGYIGISSDWVNPLYIAVLLSNVIDSNILEVSKYRSKPCEINKEDTIFLCEVLNRNHIVSETWGSPREKKFKSQVKYFKHTHVKLRNREFSARAINAINSGKHFYFYFYSLYNFYIIDALTMKVVNSTSPPRYTVQSPKYIKKVSKLSKKCKKR